MKKFLFFVLAISFFVGCGSNINDINLEKIAKSGGKDVFILHNMSYKAKYDLGNFFLEHEAENLAYSPSMNCTELGYDTFDEKTYSTKFNLVVKYYHNSKDHHCGDVDFADNKILAGDTGFAIMAVGDYFHDL